MVVLHATDPASVFLAGTGADGDSSPAAIERELYEEPHRPADARDAPDAVPGAARRRADRPRRRLAATSRDASASGRSQMLTDGGSVPVPRRPCSRSSRRSPARRGPRARRGDDRRAARDRPAARPRSITLARGKAVRGLRSAVGSEGLLPPRARRPDRARPPARHLDRQPVPLEPDRALASRTASPCCRSTRHAPSSSRRWLRAFGPGHPRRHPAGGPAGRSPRRGRPWPRSAPSRWTLDGGAVGYVLPDDLEPTRAARTRGSRCFPRSTPRPWAGQDRDWYLGPHRAGAVRPQRQRRPDDLGRRPDRGRLGAARERRDRAAAARGRRRGGDPPDRGRGRTPRGLDRPGAHQNQLPDAAGNRPEGGRALESVA